MDYYTKLRDILKPNVRSTNNQLRYHSYDRYDRCDRNHREFRMFCEKCREVKEHSLCRDELHFECKECYNETKYDENSKTYIIAPCSNCNRGTYRTYRYIEEDSVSCSICNESRYYNDFEDAKLFCRRCENITTFKNDHGSWNTQVSCKRCNLYGIEFNDNNKPSRCISRIRISCDSCREITNHTLDIIDNVNHYTCVKCNREN